MICRTRRISEEAVAGETKRSAGRAKRAAKSRVMNTSWKFRGSNDRLAEDFTHLRQGVQRAIIEAPRSQARFLPDRPCIPTSPQKLPTPEQSVRPLANHCTPELTESSGTLDRPLMVAANHNSIESAPRFPIVGPRLNAAHVRGNAICSRETFWGPGTPESSWIVFVQFFHTIASRHRNSQKKPMI